MKCTCKKCGEVYNGSDSSGGHCAACCTTFSSNEAFDKHRYGSFEDRKCRTESEMIEVKMRLTDRGWSASKPMTDKERARLKALR
jgi:hypothetical protein